MWNKSICAGVVHDIRARLPHYIHDWKDGFSSGARIFAPSTYIFFASVLPALAFGQQLERDTDGALNAVNVLAATGITGVIQAVFGGQPLLIVGVAEPIVLLYVFMYKFVKDKKDLGPELFLPWAAWVCVWSASFIFAGALMNVCDLINRFTRFSGELFGSLIAFLFAQEAITGWKDQFEVSEEKGETANKYEWRLVNGLFGLLLGLGLVLTAMLTRTARSWRFGFSKLRSLLADYGPPLMVLLWTLVSYSISRSPSDIPERLTIPNTWDYTSFWSVAQDMGKVPGLHVATAVVPAVVIAVLFFFDHTVSSQLAQVPEFNLQRPSAYNYDFLLLAAMTALCGLVGLPPVNGVLPQAPLHTKSLATLRKEHLRSRIQKSAREMAKEERESLEEGQPRGAREFVLQGLQAQAIQMNSTAVHRLLRTSSETGIAIVEESSQLVETTSTENFSSKREVDRIMHMVDHIVENSLETEVSETRLSGLLQSVMVLLCLAITPVLRKIPSAVIYGYFMFMSIESLPGSQFWDRLLFLITDPRLKHRLVKGGKAPYLENVRYQSVLGFTALQLCLMLSVWALINFGEIAGFLFPLPILALIPIRMYILPRLFWREDLEKFDPSVWEVEMNIISISNDEETMPELGTENGRDSLSEIPPGT